ncbi:general secretion pathway protein I [Sphingomonas naasensis]|uniref:Type II secretion system protein I n=1 Tax=Sphingomonas naasensis TaxID=1344951 RepID=A0A4S1WPK1_9SPHN|nr:type II secretion system minor pseudopilin GspI [Sphingomonas naasensis]NIJ20766.1 general secretion pathway protein I [Sphingomonas naasensis]TGX43176.1 type II secretion system protein GspI [Sphingomonas naasensis]
MRSVLLRKQEPRVAGDPLAAPGSCFRRSAGAGEQGFSLIEALVALAVLAIATVGLMRTVESHIDSTRGVERRTAAMWVAENRLAELEAKAPTADADQIEMLGEQWRVAVARSGTDDPEIQRIRIKVFAARETTPLASLDGFVDGRRG